jgi:uncharacterized protein (TIGR02118 family)
MIKRFVVLRRKPGMSVTDFRKYWKTIHGPLIAKIPGLLKYTQYHVHSPPGTAHPIDGIAELWFKSEADQKKAYSTPEYQAVVEDEPNLFQMDIDHIHPVMTDDIVEVLFTKGLE